MINHNLTMMRNRNTNSVLAKNHKASGSPHSPKWTTKQHMAEDRTAPVPVAGKTNKLAEPQEGSGRRRRPELKTRKLAGIDVC